MNEETGQVPRLTGAMKGIICSPLMAHYLAICESQGFSRSRALLDTGIDEQDINPPGGWVRQEIVERLFRYRLDRPEPLSALHVLRYMDPSAPGLLGFLCLSCSSILGLHNTLRDFGQLVTNIFNTWLVREPGAVLWHVDFLYVDELVIRDSVEWFLAACAMLVNRLHPGAAMEVQLAHGPFLKHGHPDPVYQKAFPCPVKFNQRRSVLMVDPMMLNKPSSCGNAMAFETLGQQGKLLLEQFARGNTIVERVKGEICALLAEGRVSREEVCKRIDISSRHLHRQLKLHGSSYQLILDELRMEFAEKHLVARHYDVNRLTLELGFSSPKSFSRWFVGKFGETPARFRQRGGGRES